MHTAENADTYTQNDAIGIFIGVLDLEEQLNLDQTVVENILVCLYNITIDHATSKSINQTDAIISHCVKYLKSIHINIADRACSIIQNLALDGTLVFCDILLFTFTLSESTGEKINKEGGTDTLIQIIKNQAPERESLRRRASLALWKLASVNGSYYFPERYSCLTIECLQMTPWGVSVNLGHFNYLSKCFHRWSLGNWFVSIAFTTNSCY